MRIPKDIPLATYIRRLIKAGKIECFYATEDWKELREDVQRLYHYECQECLKKGNYTRADCVHHVNEVRHRPDLALSKYYTDKYGNTQPNLIPLCNICHNKIHNKFEKWHEEKGKEKFVNEEKW